MDYLLEFSQRDDVRALARSYLSREEAVQGITIDLDSFWLAGFQLYTVLPYADFRRLDDELSGHAPWWPSAAVLRRRHAFGVEEFVAYPYGIDIEWRPEFWKRFTESQNRSDEPYVVVVVLRPEAPRATVLGLQETDTGGFQVRFETRPRAELYARGTDKVRPVVGGTSVSSPDGAAGTLGGILSDGGGKRFGLTCAHVLAEGAEAQQPSPKDDRRHAGTIGRCVRSTTLKPHMGPLDPYDASSLNDVDVAVIQLDESAEMAVLEVGAVTGVSSKSHVNPESVVDVVGKERGRQTLYIGGATMVQEFHHGDIKYGYMNLFELKRGSRFDWVTGTIMKPVKRGDSGAWVLKDGPTGSEWLGVVVGGAGHIGYAIPAEFVNNWLATSGEPLSVVQSGG